MPIPPGLWSGCGHLRWIRPKVEETPQGKLETFELEIALEQTYIQNSK